MVGEWRISTWGEEISLEYGKALPCNEYADGAYRVFGSNGPIGWTDQAIAPGPGVILGRKGAYRGVEFSREPFFVIDTAYYVVPKTDLDMRWLYYAMKHYKLGEVDDGSPIPSTTRAAVYMLDLRVPPRSEQRAIAHILGTLDDKIDLNERMSETLEAMARVLFNSWFVDFDPVRAKVDRRDLALPKKIADLFPDRFVDSELGEIPESWRYCPLGDLVDLVRGRTYKSSLKDLPGPVLLGLASIKRNGGFRDDKLSTYGGDSPDELVLGPGDIYASLKDVTQSADLLGAVARVPAHVKIGRLTQDTVRLRFRASNVSQEIVYRTLLTPEYRNYCRSHATGTTNLGLSRGDFLAYPIIQPSADIALAFDTIVGHVLRRAGATTAESRTLAALHDELLPRLLSGALRVKDAGRIIEAVV